MRLERLVNRYGPYDAACKYFGTEKVTHVISMLENGETRTEIRKKLAISTANITRIWEMLMPGKPLPPRPAHKRRGSKVLPVTDAQYLLAVKLLHNANPNKHDIMRQTGLSIFRISKIEAQIERKERRKKDNGNSDAIKTGQEKLRKCSSDD